MVYGLIAALGWGLSAVAATNAARRAGTYLAVLSGQGLGVLVLLLLTALLRPSFAAANGAVVMNLAGAGLLGLVGYLTFYRALEYGGAVGLVSAISATYGGVTTVLAVAVLGERLGGVGATGVALAVAGVAVAAARPATGGEASLAVGEPIVGVAPAPSRIRSLSRAGVPLALASAGLRIRRIPSWPVLGPRRMACRGAGSAQRLGHRAADGSPTARSPGAMAGQCVRRDLGGSGRTHRRGWAAGVLPGWPGRSGGRDRCRVQRLSRHTARRGHPLVRRATDAQAACRGGRDHRRPRADRPGLRCRPRGGLAADPPPAVPVQRLVDWLGVGQFPARYGPAVPRRGAADSVQDVDIGVRCAARRRPTVAALGWRAAMNPNSLGYRTHLGSRMMAA